MSDRYKSIALESLALKNLTSLDKLIGTIPKPKGAIPNFGLPRWKIMPLESKIPMIPGPKGSYHFTRNKLGKKLWVGSVDAEFNLNDPYNYESEWSYDPLHDDHLARFFSRPNNIRRMRELGLVTRKLDVTCSVKDYNMYRKYQKTLYNDSINLEIKRRALLESEKRALNLSEKFAERDMDRLRARKKRHEASSKLLEKKQLEKEAKLKRLWQQQLEVEQRLKDIELNKIEANRWRIQRASERADILKQKQEAAVYIQRQKIVKTIRQWRDSEYRRRTAKAVRELQELEKKQNTIEEKYSPDQLKSIIYWTGAPVPFRWRLRQERQIKQMEREDFLRHFLHEERVANIETYNAEIANERARMQRLSEKCKKFIKCYTRRHVGGRRDGTCCIRRRRKRKLEENHLGNSCSARSYHIQRDKSKLNDKRKENVKTEEQKKRERKRKKKIMELTPEAEPEEIQTIAEVTPTTQEHPVFKNNCKCKKIKAEFLQNRQIATN